MIFINKNVKSTYNIFVSYENIKCDILDVLNCDYVRSIWKAPAYNN